MNIQTLTYFSVLTIAFSLSSLVAYRYFTAPPPGFCVAQNRFVPAEVFAEKARNTKYLKEFDKERFTELECCIVYRGGAVNDVITKVFRIDEGVVVLLNFKRTPKELDRKRARDNGEDNGSSIRTSNILYDLAPIRFLYDSCGNHYIRAPREELRSYPIDLTAQPNGELSLSESKSYIKWPK